MGSLFALLVCFGNVSDFGMFCLNFGRFFKFFNFLSGRLGATLVKILEKKVILLDES